MQVYLIESTPHLFRLCFLYRKCPPPSLQCLLPGLSSQYTIVGLWPPVLDSWLCVHCTISLIWLLESTAGVIQRCSPLGACIPTTKVGACNIGHYVEAIKSWECSTISHWYRYPRWQYFGADLRDNETQYTHQLAWGNCWYSRLLCQKTAGSCKITV